jgi:hypothetical protein
VKNLAALVVLLACLAGCSSAASNGPLGGPGDRGQECVAVRPGGVISYGVTPLDNHGPVTVVLDHVGLADPHGLRVLAAYDVPGPSNFLYGLYLGYPPGHPLAPGIDWAAHRKAAGAKLPPTKKSRLDSLLLVIKATGRRGTASGVDIWYRAGSKQYFLQTATSILTVDRRDC